MSVRMSSGQQALPVALSPLDPWDEVPLKLHDRRNAGILGPAFIAFLDRKPLPISSSERWAVWEQEIDIIAHLVSRFGKKIVTALIAYRSKRISFRVAAEACEKTVNSLKGYAGRAVQFAQKFCRELSQKPNKPPWHNDYLAYYD